jgi:hypothetical protein
MTASTTRSRTGRGGTDARRDARTREAERGFHGAPVSGANALQIDYADPLVDDPDLLVHPEPRRRPRARPAGQPSTVAPPAPVALPRAPFLIMVVIMVIVGVLGVLVLNTKINENSFVLDCLRGQQQDLDLKEQQLSQDLEVAQSPGNLRAAAKRLGLVPAGVPAYITLPDGKIVGVPTPATAANSSTSDR